MFQKLPIANVQVKAVKTHENLLKEIREVMFFLSRKKLPKRYINEF